MSVNLQKGQKVNLRKANGQGALQRVMVGLGWDEVEQKRRLFGPKPQDIDCDASAILCRNGKLCDENDLVFYNNLKHFTGTVVHQGDNLTGAGEGDDEQIQIDLSKVPANIERIAFTVTIYEAEARRQNFGQVSNSFIRLVDETTGKEMIRYDLGEDFSIETAVVVGELYRHNGEWKFNAIGSGFQGGLAALCGHYGIEVA